MIGWNLLVVVCLLICSAFFAASETAYTSVNALRLRRSAEAGDSLARRANIIYENFEAAISAALVGNTLVNLASSSVATVVFIHLMGPGGAGVSSVVITIMVLMFSEITPKVIAKQRADQVVRLFAWPLQLVMWALTPVGKAVTFLVDAIARRVLPVREEEPTITEEEFAAILDTVEDEGVIDEDRTELLQSVLSFDGIAVQQIMRPRVDMVALDVDHDISEHLPVILDSGYSRIPVYEDTIDHIIGILHVNHFLERMVDDGEADLREHLIEPLLMHKTMTLDDALRMLRKQRLHIAIVIDEYGGTLGMVTLEDILEELVGEIWDEGDDVTLECVEAEPGVYECNGAMSIHEFFDQIDYEPDDFECEYTTLGGWAVEMLDAQPQEGKFFTYDMLTVTVVKMDGMRVDRLKISLNNGIVERIE